MSILKGSLGFKGEKGDNGVSPTVEVSKVDGTATITITDLEGEHTTTVSDGEITKAMVIDDLTHTDSDKPLSANQGKVLKTAVDNTYDKTYIDDKVKVLKQGGIYVVEGTIDLQANTQENLNNNLATLTTVTLPFPYGLDETNCVCISCQISGYSSTPFNKLASYSTAGGDSIIHQMLTGSVPRDVYMKEGLEYISGIIRVPGFNLIVGNYSLSTVSGVPYKITFLALPKLSVIKHEVEEVGTDYIRIHWETDLDRSLTEYTLDGGTTWIPATDELVSDNNGSYQIDNLTSGTTYTVRTRFKTSSTKVYVKSSSLTVTTS